MPIAAFRRSSLDRRPGPCDAPSNIVAAAGVAAAGVGFFAYAVHKARLRSSVGLSQWRSIMGPDGRVVDFEALVKHVADKGIDHEVRAELWPLLLGLYSPYHTIPERHAALAELRASYLELLLQCQALEEAFLHATATAAAAAASHRSSQDGALPGPGGSPGAQHPAPSPQGAPDASVGDAVGGCMGLDSDGSSHGPASTSAGAESEGSCSPASGVAVAPAWLLEAEGPEVGECVEQQQQEEEEEGEQGGCGEGGGEAGAGEDGGGERVQAHGGGQAGEAQGDEHGCRGEVGAGSGCHAAGGAAEGGTAGPLGPCGQNAQAHAADKLRSAETAVGAGAAHAGAAAAAAVPRRESSSSGCCHTPGSLQPSAPSHTSQAHAPHSGSHAHPHAHPHSHVQHMGHLSRADVPPMLHSYWEAQRVIAVDAVRTDFAKNTLPGSLSASLRNTLASMGSFASVSASGSGGGGGGGGGGMAVGEASGSVSDAPSGSLGLGLVDAAVVGVGAFTNRGSGGDKHGGEGKCGAAAGVPPTPGVAAVGAAAAQEALAQPAEPSAPWEVELDTSTPAAAATATAGPAALPEGISPEATTAASGAPAHTPITDTIAKTASVGPAPSSANGGSGGGGVTSRVGEALDRWLSSARERIAPSRERTEVRAGGDRGSAVAAQSDEETAAGAAATQPDAAQLPPPPPAEAPSEPPSETATPVAGPTAASAPPLPPSAVAVPDGTASDASAPTASASTADFTAAPAASDVAQNSASGGGGGSGATGGSGPGSGGSITSRVGEALDRWLSSARGGGKSAPAAAPPAQATVAGPADAQGVPATHLPPPPPSQAPSDEPSGTSTPAAATQSAPLCTAEGTSQDATAVTSDAHPPPTTADTSDVPASLSIARNSASGFGGEDSGVGSRSGSVSGRVASRLGEALDRWLSSARGSNSNRGVPGVAPTSDAAAAEPTATQHPPAHLPPAPPSAPLSDASAGSSTPAATECVSPFSAAPEGAFHDSAATASDRNPPAPPTDAPDVPLPSDLALARSSASGSIRVSGTLDRWLLSARERMESSSLFQAARVVRQRGELRDQAGPPAAASSRGGSFTILGRTFGTDEGQGRASGERQRFEGKGVEEQQQGQRQGQGLELRDVRASAAVAGGSEEGAAVAGAEGARMGGGAEAGTGAGGSTVGPAALAEAEVTPAAGAAAGAGGTGQEGAATEHGARASAASAEPGAPCAIGAAVGVHADAACPQAPQNAPQPQPQYQGHGHQPQTVLPPRPALAPIRTSAGGAPTAAAAAATPSPLSRVSAPSCFSPTAATPSATPSQPTSAQPRPRPTPSPSIFAAGPATAAAAVGTPCAGPAAPAAAGVALGQPWLSSVARYHLEGAAHFSAGQQRQVERLVTLLSAYAVHDEELGYCQGMSDLALPFLLLTEDDVVAFWCFAAFMRKVRVNLLHSQDGVLSRLAALGALLGRLDPPLALHLQLLRAAHCHFAYRLLVVVLRRELPLEGALRLWEQLWADDLVEAMEEEEARERREREGREERERVERVEREQGVEMGEVATGEPVCGDGRDEAVSDVAGRNGAQQESKPEEPVQQQQQQQVESDEPPVTPLRPAASSAPTPDDSAYPHDDSAAHTPLSPLGLPSPILSCSPQLPQSAAPRPNALADPHLQHPHPHQDPGASHPDPCTPAPCSSEAGPSLHPGPQSGGADSVTPNSRGPGSATGSGPTSASGSFSCSTHPPHQTGQHPSGQAPSPPGPPLPGPPPGRELLPYVVAAVVLGQRKRILDTCHEHDDVLRLFQSLPKVDVADVIRRAKEYREVVAPREGQQQQQQQQGAGVGAAAAVGAASSAGWRFGGNSEQPWLGASGTGSGAGEEGAATEAGAAVAKL